MLPAKQPQGSLGTSVGRFLGSLVLPLIKAPLIPLSKFSTCSLKFFFLSSAKVVNQAPN